MRVGKCEICSEKEHKYRCPKCNLIYCSLACYKQHKDTCSTKACWQSEEFAQPKSSIQYADETATLCDSEVGVARGKDGSVGETDAVNLKKIMGEMDQNDTVSAESLHRLGESAELRDLLTNPHLRGMLTSLDRSPMPDKHVSEAMREPIFTEFADACLRVVEPNKDRPLLNLQL